MKRVWESNLGKLGNNEYGLTKTTKNGFCGYLSDSRLLSDLT